MTEPVGAGTEAGDADAALEAVEPDRLLPGEATDTRYPDDARHWIRVYSELLAFKRDVLRVTEERLQSIDPVGAAEIAATDLDVLHAEERRFERRLVYWRERLTALEQQ